MKICSYSIIHYGKDYIYQALKQIEPFVDVSGVFYTSNASHNHSTNLQCPETKQDILDSLDGLNKVKFVDSSGFRVEGHHRDYALSYMKEMYEPDYILVVDSDEIWPHETLQNVIDFLKTAERKRNWLINFSHFWRSFDYIIKDNMWPVRIIDCSMNDDSIGYIPQELGDIYHFGYAITNEIMNYKMAIHGHKNELRKNWYQDKWLRNSLDDVHPTCDKTWYPKEFDKTQLPEMMRSHPFYDLEIIE